MAFGAVSGGRHDFKTVARPSDVPRLSCMLTHGNSHNNVAFPFPSGLFDLTMFGAQAGRCRHAEESAAKLNSGVWGSGSPYDRWRLSEAADLE